MLHQLDHQVLVRLIMVCNQVIDALKQGRQSATVVFFLHEEFLLRESLHQVDQTIARLTTELLSVGCQVGNHSNDRLVDWFQQARARLNQLEDSEEHEIVVGHRLVNRHVKLDLCHLEWLIKGICQFTRCRDGEEHEDAEVHQVRLRVVLLRLIQ